VEWAKSWAWSQHFTEEVRLLSEEMMRTLRHFENLSAEWKSKAGIEGWTDIQVSPEWEEGHRAYAGRQSAMFHDLRNHCASLWKDIPTHVDRMQEIILDPSIAAPGEFDNSSASKAKAKEARREARKG